MAFASFPWSQVWLVLAEGMEIETSLNFWELSLKESAMPFFAFVFWLECGEMEQWPWTMKGEDRAGTRDGGGGGWRALGPTAL